MNDDWQRFASARQPPACSRHVALAPALAMVGGAQPAADSAGRSVVMILGSYGTACTATAIARDLLLTAAHCVQPGADYKLVASEPGERPVLKDIARIERDPQFDLKRLFAHLATADVALLKLAEPLPAENPAGAARRRDRTGRRRRCACGRRLRRHRARRRPHRRHSARGDLGRHRTTRTLQIRLFDPAPKAPAPDSAPAPAIPARRCFATKTAAAVVIGVVSWSTGPNLSAGCGGLTGVTPLVRYRAWIVDTARALGSPLAP